MNDNSTQSAAAKFAAQALSQQSAAIRENSWLASFGPVIPSFAQLA